MRRACRSGPTARGEDNGPCAPCQPEKRVFQAGTLSGNPLATAAGIATLKVLRDGDAWRVRAGKLIAAQCWPTASIGGATIKTGVPAVRAHSCGRLDDDVVLQSRPSHPIGNPAASERHPALRRRYYFCSITPRMMDRGVYLPCSQFEAMFVSTAHTSEQIEETIAAARRRFRKVARMSPFEKLDSIRLGNRLSDNVNKRFQGAHQPEFPIPHR